MTSRFREKIDEHVLSTTLHRQIRVDDTTLSVLTPTLTANEDLQDEISDHLAASDLHMTAYVQGTTLYISPTMSSDIIEHLGDAEAHYSLSVSNTSLVFTAPRLSSKGLIDLEKYVPKFIADMDEMHQIYTSQGREIAREWLDVEDTEKQIFADNADWSLDMWEANYGLVTKSDLTEAERQKSVIARLTIPATTTNDLVRETAETLTGNTVWVEENGSHVNIWLMDNDISKKNIDQFIEWFETFKPAHIGYTLDYFIMRWKDCLPYNWKTLNGYTWRGVLLGLKDIITTWQNVEDAVGTWRVLNDNHTWYTAKNLKEKTTDED